MSSRFGEMGLLMQLELCRSDVLGRVLLSAEHRIIHGLTEGVCT